MNAEPVDPRLTRLVDENAVRGLVAAYSDAVTHLDAERAAALYAPDGEVCIAGSGLSGRAAIAEGMAATFAAFDMIQVVAHGGMIEIAGDTARARWSMVEFTRRKGEQALRLVMGRYDDEMVRLDGQWFFARRTYTLAGRMRFDADAADFNPAFFAAPGAV